MQLSDGGLLKDALFIDGEWVKPAALRSFEVRNPSTGALIVELPRGGRDEAAAAIDAAEAAFPAWRDLTAKQRAAIIRRSNSSAPRSAAVTGVRSPFNSTGTSCRPMPDRRGQAATCFLQQSLPDGECKVYCRLCGIKNPDRFRDPRPQPVMYASLLPLD